jgi:hypothetical protein
MYLGRLFSIKGITSARYRSDNMPDNEHTCTTWHKSSLSTYNGNCVEVASLRGGRVGVRDTKDKGAGPILAFTQSEWNSFLARARAGEFDSL